MVTGESPREHHPPATTHLKALLLSCGMVGDGQQGGGDGPGCTRWPPRSALQLLGHAPRPGRLRTWRGRRWRHSKAQHSGTPGAPAPLGPCGWALACHLTGSGLLPVTTPSTPGWSRGEGGRAGRGFGDPVNKFTRSRISLQASLCMGLCPEVCAAPLSISPCEGVIYAFILILSCGEHRRDWAPVHFWGGAPTAMEVLPSSRSYRVGEVCVLSFWIQRSPPMGGLIYILEVDMG